MAVAAVGPTMDAVAAAQPQPAVQDGPSAAPIRAFFRSLTAEQRKTMCFEWDHTGFSKLPLRLHVTNNWDISRAAISSFTRAQQLLIDDIIASVMNPGWPEALRRRLLGP
jgi:hypothetical protein